MLTTVNGPPSSPLRLARRMGRMPPSAVREILNAKPEPPEAKAPAARGKRKGKSAGEKAMSDA